MIPMKFFPPNFRCKVKRKGEEETSWRLEHGASEADVRGRLEREEFVVLKVKDYDFEDWKKKADEERGEAIKARKKNEAYKFKDSIWTELKDYLFRLFHGKCAYCEGRRGAVTSGAVEHYRPKTALHEDETHPGYYWLAYDYRNYVPVCPDCNSKKGTRFPIANPAARARSPDDPLEAEEPTLLHPYEANGGIWGQFNYEIVWEAGTWNAKLIHARPKSKRAEASIEVLGLNRNRLPEERALAQTRTLQAFQLKFAVRPNPVVENLKAGIEEYSAACLAAMNHILHEAVDGE